MNSKNIKTFLKYLRLFFRRCIAFVHTLCTAKDFIPRIKEPELNSIAQDKSKQFDNNEILIRQQGAFDEFSKSETLMTQKNSSNDFKELLILYVTPYRQGLLYGEPLLRSLLQLGFRYGDRFIFHRHLNPIGSGPILFSLANMVKPGTFAFNNMGDFSTPGVALFITLPATYGDPVQNFKLMVQAAQRMADELGGVVLDDQHNMLTLQKIEEYKNRVREQITI